MEIGIEKIALFGGSHYISLQELAERRNFDQKRFENLLINEKSVALPYEDPITSAVTAAKKIVDQLSEDEFNAIEQLIVCTESGVDFGKSISSYVHEYLKLPNNIQFFEIKQACYSGVAGLQTAINKVLMTNGRSKSLVIASDMARFHLKEGEMPSDTEWGYAELTSGFGAVAVLIGNQPDLFTFDLGANGYHSFNVLDTCRPAPDIEAGDPDLSLLSYLDCSIKAYQDYFRKVENCDFRATFDQLCFHTPFGSMVKGAHRNMSRKIGKMKPDEIEKDFEARVGNSLVYSKRVGNILGASFLMALKSCLDFNKSGSPYRVGCFSYGSGCSSEFFSGWHSGAATVDSLSDLDARNKLEMDNYERLIRSDSQPLFGVKNLEIDTSKAKEGLIVLSEIRNFERIYKWI